MNKLAIREAALVVLLAAATFALTWKAKGLEKRLLGQSDEAVMTNRPAPDFDAQTLSGENVATRDFKGKKKIVVSLRQTALKPTTWSEHGASLFYGLDYALVFLLLAVWSFSGRREAKLAEKALTYPRGAIRQLYGVLCD